MEEVNKNSGKKWEGESEADRKASRRKADKMKTERRKKTTGDGAAHQSKEKDDNQGKRIRELVYRLRIWMVLFAALISVYMGSRIWKEYRDSIISQQKEQMYLNVRSLRDNLRLFISECIADLDGLHRLSSAQREENQELLEDYVGSHSRFVYDVCLEESDQLLYSTRGSKIEKVYSDSRIDETKNLMLAQLNDGKMYLVLRAVLENGNSLSMVIRLEEYYQAMIENLRIGTSGYVVVKDSSGIILMHPEQQQWGIDVIEGRMSMYPELNLDSLSQMIDHQKQGQEGTEEYYSYWWTKEGYPRVKKICAYAPAWIGEDFLIVSEVIDYDDIYHPIVSGALKLFGFCFFIFSMLAVMAISMLQMVWQRKQDTRQIAYLTELNRILEDMHRSEETIAHQQRLQIMGTMTGGIAHEFNNLLTPIMGYADLLMMELPEDSEQKEYAMEICEAAEKAKIGVVDRIFTRVGASDDLASGQSTFMVEMTEVANILRNATAKSLLILDEIGRGTSTFDGLSIAWAVIEHISNTKLLGAKTLFATHYHELTELEGKIPGVNNYCIAVKERGDDIVFLRKIVKGGADKSYGIQVAKLAGVPDSVLDRAKELVDELVHTDITSTFKDLAENSRKTKPKAVHYDEVDLEQISLFDTVQDQDIIEELKNLDITMLTPMDAMNTLYRLQNKLKNRW